jgi:hypothetical protein
MVEFGDNLSWTYVMGGLARDYTKHPGGAEAVSADWLDVADASGMPVDPRLWREGGIGSSYPACMAVEAAAQQARDDAGYSYLRALREGLMCFRRKLDTVEALVEEARRAGLSVERLRADLGSSATVEAFGDDLEATRAAGAPLPSIAFEGGEAVPGPGRVEDLRAAALAAGAEPLGADRPGGEEARSRRSAACPGRARRRRCGGWRRSGGCGRRGCSPGSCGSSPRASAYRAKRCTAKPPSAIR